MALPPAAHLYGSTIKVLPYRATPVNLSVHGADLIPHLPHAVTGAP